MLFGMPLAEWQRLQRVAPQTYLHNPAQWNDAPDRTWEDIQAVVEAYDRDRLLHPEPPAR